jgi:hypothetical protein
MARVKLDHVIEAFTELLDFVSRQIPIAGFAGEPELRVAHLLKRHDFAEAGRVGFALGIRSCGGRCLLPAGRTQGAARIRKARTVRRSRKANIVYRFPGEVGTTPTTCGTPFSRSIRL